MDWLLIGAESDRSDVRVPDGRLCNTLGLQSRRPPPWRAMIRRRMKMNRLI